MNEIEKAEIRRKLLYETLACESARTRYHQEVTGKYDDEVYLPALREIQARCGAIGHSWNEKGLDRLATHRLYYCSVCGNQKKEPIEILVVRSKRNKGSFFG